MFSKIKNKQINTVFTVVLLFFLLFTIYPLIVLFKNAFTQGNGSNAIFSFINFKNVFVKGKFLQAFWNSTKVSFISAVITTILAFILAYTENFTSIPLRLKKLLRTLAVFPMLLPTITYGFAVIYSFGKNGLITRLFGFQLFDFYGFKGLIFCYVIYTLPISFTLIRNTMSYIDKRFLIVCRVMGDSSIKSFNTAIFQPLLGTLAVSLVQSFFLSFTDFGIPASIGGRYTVIAELLYNTMLGSLPDFHQGSVIALFMLLPSVLSILLLNYLQRFNVRYNKLSKIDLQKNIARDVIWTIISFIILICILCVFVIVFVAPFVTEWPYEMGFTFKNVQSVFADKSLTRVFTNSLTTALLTAIFGTGFVYIAALASARSKLHPFFSKVIASMAQVSNALPGMVLGIAFLLAFKKTPLHNTMIIIILCNMVHFFATPFLMMKGALDKMNDSWENTALLLGDNWIKTVVRIITPNALVSLMEIFIYLFINGLVTVSALVFLTGARTMVITTKIQELQHFAKFNEIFILSILIFITNLIMKTIKGVVNKYKGEK
ncbi:MAG: ABC transporter permease subunit [Treponema sp.]|nr:ABC transporter permease subunit [Treponema sp.]